MKLAEIVLRDRIPSLSVTSFKAGELYAMALEAGLVTIQRLDRPDEEPFIVPVSNVIFMRPEKGAPKKK